jgi:nitrogenase iron protein NifH
VLDQIKNKGSEINLGDIVFAGYKDVACVESGGPPPGIGCAGRGIITAFQKLEELDAYKVWRPDLVFYDVLGDVVCGGFAMPIREGYAEHVFIVTSGEMMSMFAAENILRAIENFGKRGYARCGGLILNARGVKNEEDTVHKFAEESGVSVVKKIPRDKAVQEAEDMGLTVVEAFPDSPMAREYHELADRILEVI